MYCAMVRNKTVVHSSDLYKKATNKHFKLIAFEAEGYLRPQAREGRRNLVYDTVTP